MQKSPKTYTTTTPIAEAFQHAIGAHNNGQNVTPELLAGVMSIDISTARNLLDSVMALHHKIENSVGGVLMSKDGKYLFCLAPHPDA